MEPFFSYKPETRQGRGSQVEALHNVNIDNLIPVRLTVCRGTINSDNMKKFLAYLFSAIAAFGMCISALYAFATPPAGRSPYAFGAALGFLLSLILSGYGNTLPWKKDKE